MYMKHTHSISYNEEIVKKGISEWVSEYGIDVFFEKKNAFGYDIFHTKTGAKKPDLLFLWKDNVVLVEVKYAESYSNVYDAFFQLIGYYNDISTVKIGNKQLSVTGFIVATQYCKQGRLFQNEPLETYETFGDGRKHAATNGYLPISEYKLSEMFIRLLWRATQKKGVFIGALLSSVLNYPGSTPIPSILAKRDGKQIFKEMRK